MLFEDKDLVYLDFLCTGKPLQLSKNELNDQKWVYKKAKAVSRKIDFLPINLGSINAKNKGWVLVDLKRSETAPVFSDNLATIYRGDSFVKTVDILLNSPKDTLLLILDEHFNLKGVLNKEDLTNLYFVSRVYTSLHVLEVLGLHSIALLPGGLIDFYNEIRRNNLAATNSPEVNLLDILNKLSSVLILQGNNLYFNFHPSSNRSIQHTNLSIYELRNKTMHPRVNGVTSFRIDKTFLRDFTYVENAIKDLIKFCGSKMGEEEFKEWVIANI